MSGIGDDRWVWTVEDDVRTLLGEPPVERHPGDAVEVGDMIETVSQDSFGGSWR